MCVGGGAGLGICGQNIYYLAAIFCDSNKFDMQHDHDLKKVIVDLSTQRSSSSGISGQNICYHVAIFRNSI